MTNQKKPRVLVFVVAYNAERTIESVLSRIPASLSEDYEVEILAIDDASRDRTFEIGHQVKATGSLALPLRVLFNPVNQGYGGNQKIGYHYAIKNDFDFVALVHGDGQYAPEALPELLNPLSQGMADAVFGSRMLGRGAALKGGMPLYKFVGNKILTWCQNRLLRTHFSEFHSGYRIYSVAALKRVPFDRNTNDFHFDTEIIIQLLIAGMRVRELPIPTYYGDEICHVNGIQYAWKVLKATLKSRIHEWNIFYDSKFDCAPGREANAHYEIKIGFDSPHTATLGIVPAGAKVLDLGCAGGYMSALLEQERGCQTTGVDKFPLASNVKLSRFIEHDLNAGVPDVNIAEYDYVLLLDVIEHLNVPEVFFDRLRDAMKQCTNTQLIISTPNVGFVIIRLMLLLGQFNYGKRGILDMTHTRLFTFSALRQLLEQRGFQISKSRGIPAPFPVALGSGLTSRFLLAVNKACIRLLPSLFSYQMFVVAQPTLSLEVLLQRAIDESSARAEKVGAILG
ncbi:MAG TPA: bifunctional glycosyltransferase/class I SAM-dependent methyltransferase [Candidatus Binatia bacterium]